jgi:hypothetical protein
LHEFILGRVLIVVVLVVLGIIVVGIVVVLVLGLVVLHAGDDGEGVGVFEVEEDFDGAFAAADLDGFARMTAEREVRRCWPSRRSWVAV